MNTLPDVSVIVPLYNEENRLPACIGKWQNYRAGNSVAMELILVPNGCTDKTEQYSHYYALTRPWVRVLTIMGRGKGAAVREGMLAARGQLCYMADVDLSAPIREICKFRQAIAQGVDVVIGSRAVDSAQVQVSVKRWVIGRAFHAITNLVVPGILDTQCGFKMFTARAAREIFSLTNLRGLAFDVEVLYLARRMGFSVAELPVEWAENSDSRVRLVNDSVQMLWDVLRVPLVHAQSPSLKKTPA